MIVDDILDTGATLVSACEKLVAAGAEELYICITHGLFTGKEWHNLWSLPVKHIFCTDTIPACANIRDPRITVFPVAPVLREVLNCRPVATQKRLPRRARFLPSVQSLTATKTQVVIGMTMLIHYPSPVPKRGPPAAPIIMSPVGVEYEPAAFHLRIA